MKNVKEFTIKGFVNQAARLKKVNFHSKLKKAIGSSYKNNYVICTSTKQEINCEVSRFQKSCITNGDLDIDTDFGVTMSVNKYNSILREYSIEKLPLSPFLQEEFEDRMRPVFFMEKRIGFYLYNKIHPAEVDHWFLLSSYLEMILVLKELGILKYGFGDYDSFITVPPIVTNVKQIKWKYFTDGWKEK